MGNLKSVFKNLNKFGQQSLVFALVLSLTIPQNLFANNPDGSAHNIDLAEDRMDVTKLIKPGDIPGIGIPEQSIQFLNTSGTYKGTHVDLDVFHGQINVEESHKITKIFKRVQEQVRKAHAIDPNVTFKFIHVTESGNNQFSFDPQQILNLNTDTISQTENVKISHLTSEKLKRLNNIIFSKTSNSDFWYGGFRLVLNGGSASYSFWVSDLPLPTSLMIGGILGLGSAGIGVFIEHFTTWLDKNTVDPKKKFRNRVMSPETFMFMSPLLVGLTETGFKTPEGAMYLAGMTSLGVVVQNLYHIVKKRSPHSAMWYKWYATEALFLTVPTLLMYAVDNPANNGYEAALSLFKYALMTTASQGIWDIFITKARRPSLEVAIRKDLMEFDKRIVTSDMSPTKADQVLRQHEFAVREKYKPFFLAASFISVTFAIAGTTGRNNGSQTLQDTGFYGLVALGTAGGLTWIAYELHKADVFSKIKNKIKKMFIDFKPIGSSSSIRVNSCKLLFDS